MSVIISKYLKDILDAIQEIEVTIQSKELRYETFVNDFVFRKFVERNIEIMGEAVNRILKIDPKIEITNARKIVDCRNYVIHAYDSLRPDILWSVVVNHIPLLRLEVERLICLAPE